MASTDSGMNILRGATYQRRVTWNRPLTPADYKAELIIRRRYDDANSLVDINSVDDMDSISIEQVVVGESVAVQIYLGADLTALLPIGEFVASHRLSLLADPTQAWVVNWQVSITTSTFAVS